MGKRKRKKISSTLTWKATQGFFHLLFQGILKAGPLVFFGVIGCGIFWGIHEELYADSGFLVQNVAVVPEGVLLPERIQELEKSYLGQNLFKISLRRAAESIERDPKIREARVIREFPKTLRVEIASRSPLVQIQLTPRGPYYAVGEDGVVLDTRLGRDENLLLSARDHDRHRLGEHRDRGRVACDVRASARGHERCDAAARRSCRSCRSLRTLRTLRTCETYRTLLAD